MKSLEIINERIESTLKAEDKLKMEFQLCFYKDEANCIKQDLEVLEIIRKKKVDVYYLHTLLKNGEVDVVLNRYNIYAREGALTMGELLKLKQWLEKEEN